MCFTGGPGAESLPGNAGDTGSIPGLGGFHIPWGNGACAPQLLSPSATTGLVPGNWKRVGTQERRPNTIKNKCINKIIFLKAQFDIELLLRELAFCVNF